MAQWWTEYKKKRHLDGNEPVQQTDNRQATEQAPKEAGWWTQYKQEHNYQAASREAAARQAAALEKRRAAQEAAIQQKRIEQLSQLSAGMGPQFPQAYRLPEQTKTFLDPVEQFKNGMQYKTRSFPDRDSVLQGKVLGAATQLANSAALAGNATAYARHLGAIQKAAGNLEQNDREESNKRFKAYLKDNPDVAYARQMNAEEISGKIRETEQERAALEARRKEIWDERQGMRLRGEVAGVNSHGVAGYGPKDKELEKEDAEIFARLLELEKDSPKLYSALEIRRNEDAQKDYILSAQKDSDYKSLASKGRNEFNSYVTRERNTAKERENEGLLDKIGRYLSEGGGTADTSLPLGTMQASVNAMRNGEKLPDYEVVNNAVNELDDDLAEMFYYWWDKDREKAVRYLDYAQRIQKERNLQHAQEWTQKHPVLGTLAGAGMNLLSGADFLGAMAEATATGFIGEHQPDIYISEMRDAFHEGVGQNFKTDVGKFLYQVGTSMLDSGVAMATGNTVPAFFLSAASSEYLEAKKRGASDEQALLSGALSGLAECVFEEVSVEKLLSQDTSRDFLKSFLQQSFTEASEEVTTSLANSLSDLILSRAYSFETKTEARRRELIEQGLSYDEATRQARVEWLEGILQDGLAGAASGGGMTGFHYTGAKIASWANNRNARGEGRKAAAAMTEEVAKQNLLELAALDRSARDGGDLTNAKLIQSYAKGIEDELKARAKAGQSEEAAADRNGEPVPYGAEEATAKHDGEPVPYGAENGGQIARATEEAVQAAREMGRSTAIRAAETMDDKTIQASIRASEEGAVGAMQEGDLETAAMHEGIVQGFREVFDQRMAQSDGLEFTGALRREYGNDASAQKDETPPHPSPAATPSPQGEGLGGQIARATADGGRPMTAPTENGGRAMLAPTENGGRAMLAPTMDGGQIARATEQEGLNYGADRAESGSGLADGVQWDAGLGTGGQAGSLGESAGGSVARGGRAQELAQLKNLIRASESPRTSAKAIGVRGGTNNQNLFVFSEDEQTPGMQQVQEDAAANGINVVFFGGGRLEVRSKDGRIQKADALYQTNRDGSSTMYIRADLAKYTPEQLYKHESFHDAVAKNKGLLLDMVNDLYEQYTEAEISKMVDAYVVATDGIYGDGEDAVRLYLEEILADQYSGMNRGDKNAARAREAVAGTAQRFAGDIEKARQNRAGIDNRNGPEQRFSIEHPTFSDEDLRKNSIELQKMQTVKELTGNEFAKGGTKFADKIREYFNSLGNNVYSKQFGDVALVNSSVRSEIKHGMTPVKNAAYAAIPEVIQQGKVIYLIDKGHGLERIVVAAPISIGEKKYYMGVMLQRDQKNQRLYLHDVATEEELNASSGEHLNPTGSTEGNNELPTTDILRNAINVKENFEEGEIDWIGRSNAEHRFSAAADEEDDGLDLTGELRRTYEEDGGQVDRATETGDGALKEGTPPHPSPAATPSPQGEGLETGDADSSPAAQNDSGEDFEMLAREKKLALAEKVGIDGLKSRIKTAEDRLRMWKAMEKTGLMARDEKSVKELKSRIADAQETVDIFRDALKKKQEARKAEQADKAAKAERQKKRSEEKKALRKEAELADNKPRQARKEFREDALGLFSVPAAKRQALGNILNSFADKMLAKGSVDTEDRAELFRQLYEAGVEVIQAEDYYRNIRDAVDEARIYVPESVRAEFGDDWNSFRQRAWGNGVYLTNNQNDRGADSWNAELAEMFRGSFDLEETDARAMLENIVDLAEEGKAEFVSLPEMMRRTQNETGVSVDEQMDELERKMDHMIDTFAKKADLETRVRTQGAMKLAKERQKNRELAARQVQRKRENDTRNEVMKQLQSLNKMRKRSAPEIQKQIDEIIGNLDTMARSISPEGMENLQALSRKYLEAKDDPNFLGNPYVEARLARLSQVQLDDLEISDVIELGRMISALVKSVTEDKRLLTDEREKEISEAAKEVNKEIASSAGSKGGKLREFLGNEHLSPTRELQRIGGWNRGGMMEKLSRTLEDGGTQRMDYQRQATRIFDGFLADKANQRWLQKAQGKDADWIKVTVPAGITDEGGTVKWDNVSFEITPMMRVGLLMHSRNVDNLRHIETGGIVIPNREYYRKGDLANADAKGTRVKLRPEIVRAIVKDCTPQERAFASLLEKYYDGFSKEKINEVSMLIDGFERAGGDHYYGIKVSRKFLASLPEQIQKNMALESIGSIVNERVHAGNPIILEDASKALTDHIDLISKYYGFTAPIRDFNAVMNYTFHGGMNENGVTNPYAGSIKEALQDKWGAGAQKYIDDLLADLQQSSGINETAAQFLAKLRGNLAGASLMFNPAVALSQTASLPGAMQTLGIDGVAASLKPAKVDMGLIEKYSPVLWYRNQGNSTQELGDYMARQGLEGKLPFFFNWIQKMDAWTIRRLWAGAEYRVSKDTDLAPGSKAEIDAGTDPYYQEVARVFQRAVYDTQPNYSEMQRPAILRSKSDLTKMLTMYKTVPLQYYNMMYEAAGRLKADKARYEQDGSAENKANYAKSRSFAAKTFAGVLGANVVYVVMKAAIKALLGGKDKKYKDEEGDWDAGKIFGSLGKDLVETYAGSVIFGSELLSSMEKLYNAATTGSYSRYGGLEISALGAVEDTLGSIYNLAKELHDQDLTGGLGAIKDLAKQISMDLGVPANNIETYLLGTAKWFAPEWVDRYENFFDEFERADLKGEHGKDLRAALRVLMDNRTDGLKDETIDELMRLWETGQNAAVPSGIPSSVSVDGEDVEIKGADRSTFRERWGQVVGENLEQLITSDAYKDADDAGKAKLISKLYEYARQQAAAAVTDKQPDSWVTFGQACEAAGIPLTDYLAVASVDKSKLKDMDGQELDNAIRNRMSFRVGDLDEKTLDELGRLYADGETGVIPADVPTGISVGGEETKLTPEQRVEWLRTWKRTAGENLEALMASNSYKKADDDGKAKLISALYDVARASASDEVVHGYEPDKWIRTGLGAEERGVPIDEYAAFHVNLSGLKTSEKLDLLKKQHWTNDQKEYVWEQTMATDSQLAKYQNLKNVGVSWSDAMDRLGFGASTTTTTLTESQQAQYDKYWNEISGPATQRLLNNSAYKSADKATQTEYLDRLNDYAARSAKAKVLPGYDKGKWVECGERLTSAGVKLDDYIVYYQNTSEANNRAKYEALAKTGWTDSQKLIAMEYISSSTYSAGKVGQSYEVPLTSYLEALSKADADQSGNINQEEATVWIDSSSVAWDLKAYLWQMLCYSSKWKNNPYSATRGEEIWHSLHPDN